MCPGGLRLLGQKQIIRVAQIIRVDFYFTRPSRLGIVKAVIEADAPWEALPKMGSLLTRDYWYTWHACSTTLPSVVDFLLSHFFGTAPATRG